MVFPKNGLLRHRSGGGLCYNGRCEATTDHLEFTGSGARETGGCPPGWGLVVVVLKGPFEKVGSCEVFDLTQINPEMIKRCKKMLALFSPAGFTV